MVPNFSYESWARSLSISSKSYLRFAVIGKRKISDDLSIKLCQVINFNEIDKEYFINLIKYSQSKDSQIKQSYAKKLTQILRREVPFEELPATEDLLENPLVITIRNILSYSDLPKNRIEFISEICNIDLAMTKLILKHLQELNLISDEIENYQAKSDSIKVKSQNRSSSISKYHKQSLLNAIEAQRLPVEERNFRSLSLAFSENEYKLFLEELNQFCINFFSKYNDDKILNKRIYQINFNAIPLTKRAVFEEDFVESVNIPKNHNQEAS